MFQLKSNQRARHESKEVKELSRPGGTSLQHSPPKSDRVDKLSLGEGPAKSSSRRSSKAVNLTLLVKHQKVLTKPIVQIVDSDDLIILHFPQSPKFGPSVVFSFLLRLTKGQWKGGHV